jgi:signal transduction histidine kinase
MTVDEVRTKPADAFTPFDRAISLGYTADTVWVRLKVDPSINDGMQLDNSRLVLRITNPLLNTVRLFDPLQNSGKPLVIGDLYPNTQTELDLSSLTFLLPIGAAPRDIYLSVQSTSSIVFSVVLEPVERALQHNRTYDLFGGLYLGLLVVFLVLAIALRVGRSDLVTNLFIVQQALAIIWSLTLMGYTRQYVEPLLPTGLLDPLTNLIVVLYTFAVCQFATVFLGQFRLKHWIRGLVYLPIVIYVPLILVSLVGYPRLALSINALCIIGLSVLAMLAVLFGVDWKDASVRVLPRWLVTLFFVVFGFATPLATSVTLHVEPVFQNAFVGFFVTTALAGVLMSSLLLYRSRAIAGEAMANAMALKLQQQRSQEQAKFLGMLAHEFKTPLSIIKMVMGSAKLDERSSNFSNDAIQNIDALLEKCLQAESIMDATTISQPVALNIEDMVRDVVDNSHRPGSIDLDVLETHAVYSDPTLVRIVLANLVDNALKYAKTDTVITIKVYADSDNEMALNIANEIGAAGAPDPVQVFDKYYRAAGAMSQSGSGLGLYLSKYIAQLLGGDLRYVPQSTRLYFEFRLPTEM